MDANNHYFTREVFRPRVFHQSDFFLERISMDQIDEFASMFRRAERESFGYANIPISNITVVTDADEATSEQTRDHVKKFIPGLDSVENWRLMNGSDYQHVAELIQKINETQTDLIVTYRHLHESSFVPQHSLGVYLDVMTQSTSIPVLVLPGTSSAPQDLSGNICDRTMVIADTISGDNRLINYGIRFCPDAGTMWLCHVEDDRTFERYLNAISRIPEIESERARTLIDEQLLKEAKDFIASCIEVLQQERNAVQYESRVTRGHFLRQYKQLIEDAEIDLVVVNTKDDDQLAMKGMAYSLSVELDETALLLL
jgi:hypothetical protein